MGRSLSFGGEPTSAIVGVTTLDLRCVMVNLDPDTAESDPRLLKAIARENKAFAGVYAVPVRTGTVHVGDALFALS